MGRFIVAELPPPVAEGDCLLSSSLYITQRFEAAEPADRPGGSHQTGRLRFSQNDRRSGAHIHARGRNALVSCAGSTLRDQIVHLRIGHLESRLYIRGNGT